MRPDATFLASAPVEEYMADVITQLLKRRDQASGLKANGIKLADGGQLVKGTVGHDDEYLLAPAGRRKLTDAKVRNIRWRYDDGIRGVTQAELAAEFGVSASPVSDITTGRTGVAEVPIDVGSEIRSPATARTCSRSAPMTAWC
jgi:hypothetical protein